MTKDRKHTRAAADVTKNARRRRVKAPPAEPPGPPPPPWPRTIEPPPAPAPLAIHGVDAPAPVNDLVAVTTAQLEDFMARAQRPAGVGYVTVILVNADRTTETRREIPISDRHGPRIECDGATWAHIDTAPDGTWRYARI